jgi:hypothetical protein
MPMRSSSLPGEEYLCAVAWKATVLALLVVASGCGRIPNTIPFGYEGTFKDAARASTAARVDYPIVYSVAQDAPSIPIRVTKNGERFWVHEKEYWEQKLWKSITWYRFSLTAFGVENAICETGPITPGSDDVLEVRCNFTNNTTANDYKAKPLNGTLDYWVGGDETTPPDVERVPPTGSVERLYYLILK